MFTGLIEDIGRLSSRQILGDAGKLTIATSLPFLELKLGDSIAVNGVCLTIEDFIPNAAELVFHTLTQTLNNSNLGACPVGGAVNLERALCLSDRLGGHMVSGHVDCCAQILEISQQKGDFVVTISLPDSIKELVVERGSIAVNGISLTIASLQKSSFRVHLIPHSWSETNLSSATAGEMVNIEADMVGKYILRSSQVAAESSSSQVSMNKLYEAGF